MSARVEMILRDEDEPTYLMVCDDCLVGSEPTMYERLAQRRADEHNAQSHILAVTR